MSSQPYYLYRGRNELKLPYIANRALIAKHFVKHVHNGWKFPMLVLRKVEGPGPKFTNFCSIKKLLDWCDPIPNETKCVKQD